METLLEDYQRRLATAEELISKNSDNGSIMDIERRVRLQTKASEYRSFIADIERAIKMNRNHTTIVVNEDQEFGPITVVDCCKIGPITSENYCPKCGKKIIRN